MHLLGLGIDEHSAALADLMAEFRIARAERNPKVVARLQALGLAIDEVQRDDILTYAMPFLEKMIRRDRNHPAVVFWSMCNESATDNEIGTRVMRRLIHRAKELDGTRPVTFVLATRESKDHRAFEDADFVSINVYAGGYHGKPARHTAEVRELIGKAAEEYIRRQLAAWPDKPMIVAEFGTPGVPGIHGDVTYTEKNAYAADRLVIRRWLLTSLLKGIYGDAADTLLAAIRDVLSKADLSAGFPLDTLVSRLVTMNKSVRFEPEEIDALLYSGYGQRRTFSILAVLYPSLDYGHHFHQDHVVPRALLTRKKLTGSGAIEDDIAFALDHVNNLPNLQLLEGIPNQEKSDLPLDDWLKKAYPEAPARAAFKERNYIPDVPATPANFREFYEARRQLMLNRLQDILGH